MTTEENIIEIAWKQRYLLLLHKVKSNQALSKTEISELQEYERRAKKKKHIAKDSNVKAGPRKLTISRAEVKQLALECESLVQADELKNNITKDKKSLSEMLNKNPKLNAAWDRGRFLRNLRDLARTGASISQAAKKLGLANGRILRTMIDEDAEVGDLWEQTQLEVYLEIKTAIIEAAKEGKADAVRAVESFLLEEKEQPVFDTSHITTLQLTELIGKTRKTIHEWHTKFGLPRNSDKTFDLSIFFAWFEEYLLKKVSVGEKSAAVLDPLRAMRAEKLKVELASHRNELVDRNDIIIGQVTWVQNIISICSRNIDELSRLCCNQPREKIEEIHRVFFRDLHSAAVNIPKELHLPVAQERKLKKILQELKPSNDRGEVTHDN
ncbi:hypothetical protein ES707_11616 [subsurface metagenome]